MMPLVWERRKSILERHCNGYGRLYCTIRYVLNGDSMKDCMISMNIPWKGLNYLGRAFLQRLCGDDESTARAMHSYRRRMYKK